MHLSSSHVKLLKKIKRKNVIRTNKRDIEDIEYLRSNELVVICSVDKKDDFYCQPIITEKGKAVLEEKLDIKRRANIAMILSLLALIISFLVAFTPFSDWFKELILLLFSK